MGRKVKSVPEEKKKAVNVKKAAKKGKPFYFDQADVTRSWTGHWRKPEWEITWLGNGVRLEDLIKQPS